MTGESFSVDVHLDVLIAHLFHNDFDVRMQTKTDAFRVLPVDDGLEVTQLSMCSSNRTDGEEQSPSYERLVHYSPTGDPSDGSLVSSGDVSAEEYYSFITSVETDTVVNTTYVYASKELLDLVFMFSSDAGAGAPGVAVVEARSDYIAGDKIVKVLEFLGCENIRPVNEELLFSLASSLRLRD